MEGSKIKVIQPTYPGVYSKGEFNLSLSMDNGSTAVPVFAHNQGLIKSSCPVRINSWQSFMELDDVKQASDNLFSYLLSVSLKAYFENGGGHCYLLSSDNLAAEVPKLDDVTLIVAAGENLVDREIFGESGLCSEGRSLFALLDAPAEPLEKLSSRPEGLYPATKHAAMYYPYLTAEWAKTEHGIPPSAVMAGIFCLVDRERGVWKAPANVRVEGDLIPKTNVSDEMLEMYSGRPLNFLRQVSNVGTLVWGARTMALTDDGKYIPVRRLSDTVERDIRRALASLAFEPNTPSTQGRVKSAINSYLDNIWQQGGLTGAKPEEAYFVQVGEGITMTREDVLAGRMIVKIGMAAIFPAEFSILQFTQELGQQ